LVKGAKRVVMTLHLEGAQDAEFKVDDPWDQGSAPEREREREREIPRALPKRALPKSGMCRPNVRIRNMPKPDLTEARADASACAEEGMCRSPALAEEGLAVVQQGQ